MRKIDGYPDGVDGRDPHFDMPSTDEDEGTVLVLVEGRRCRLHPENIERLVQMGYEVEYARKKNIVQ